MRARSISWHLGVACVLVSLPATAFFGVILWQYASAERERLVQQGVDLARNIADEVEQDLASLTGTIRLAAATPRLAEGNLDPEATQRSAASIARSLGADIVVRTTAGQQLVNTLLGQQEAFPLRPLDVDGMVMKTRSPAVSDLFFGAPGSHPMVAVVAPSVRPNTGEVTYLLDLTIPVDRIRDRISREPLGPGLYATVLDRKGRVIARTRAHDQFVGTEATQFMKGVTGREGVFRTASLEGIPILVQYARVNDADWIVAVGLEEATLDAPVERLVLLLLVLGLCLALLSTALAVFFGRRITGSIQGLADAAAALGRGDHVPALATPISEVNRVGAALKLAAGERKKAEESQGLMVRELHHRVKNTLATVQAVVSSTARTAESITEFREAVTDRIASLAKTHTLLVNNAWGGASLRDILLAELGPYETGQERIKLSGPDVHVPDDVALAFGMAVHELTTNAAKYGSLSLPTGCVQVTWSVDAREAGRRLIIEWREEGGPAVQQPTRRGFGSTLLERVLGKQLQGQVRIDYAPEGLAVRIDAPLT